MRTWELRALLDEVTDSLIGVGLPVRPPGATGLVTGCGLVASFPPAGSLPDGVVVYWCAGERDGPGRRLAVVVETIMNAALSEVVTAMGYPTRPDSGGRLSAVTGSRCSHRCPVMAGSPPRDRRR